MLNYFSSNWCTLNWVPWIRIKTKREERKIIPNSQGVYRVRPRGKDFLVYVGQTNQLKRRTGMLALNSYKEEMPWNDPHTAAPNLWVWRQEQGWDYEVSVAATPAITRQKRQGLECLLLWRYRLERGESTLCNHGRFHPDYVKSSNRLKGIRGRKLDSNETRNPAGGPSSPPLRTLNTHMSSDWMGLSWTEFEKLKTASLLPADPGVYKLVDLANHALLYVGETDNLRSRLNQHKRKFLDTVFSYVTLSSEMLHYERLEIENDLIGYHYYITGKSPSCQFGKERSYSRS
jgi:predicted GIY-YIG superfamily endonuclease